MNVRRRSKDKNEDMKNSLLQPPMRFSKGDYDDMKVCYSGLPPLEIDTELARTQERARLRRSASLQPFRFEVSPTLPPRSAGLPPTTRMEMRIRPKSAHIGGYDRNALSKCRHMKETLIRALRKKKSEDTKKLIHLVLEDLEHLEGLMKDRLWTRSLN